uniref:Reverse transcriptase Ty1/copia-type domain-containing protein n=2 Tax=Vitis vinifera TaxID=29760 RepID=A5C8T0_VITVI|nr:hypothetical protein VITISV_007358 [Vitis vinifera]
MITSEKLVGSENYLSWSASVELWFMGQGYEDHLVKQEADIPEVDKVQWRKIDAQLCSVLWQSVDPKILHHLRAYETCFKFWNQAKGLYTNDIQRLYKVASSIVNVRQQDMDLSTYIGQIASLKEEFLTVMPLTTDVGDQRIQIDKFFMVLTLIGLRPDLETVRNQILGSSSVPSLDDVFARLLRISSTQTLPSDNTSDSSVLVSQTNSRGGRSGNRGRGQRPHCTYCNKLGHTRDRCYQLHGRPPRTAHVAQSSDPQSPQPPSSSTSQGIFLTNSEYDDYLRYQATKSAFVAFVAQTGNASACLTHTSSLGPWILDSGAFDHISGNKDLFSSITTTSALPTVTLANGSDYGDTFSPIAKIASVRLLLSMAAMRSWPLYQLDIKNVFLHRDLAEEGESGLVCKLRRSLYGLKQSPRVWFSHFSSVVQEFGMFRSTADHSVFYHHNSSGQCIYLVVYVDDIVITSSDQNGIQNLKQHLFTHFQTKDLGKLKYFLGIEIAQSSSGVVLSQRKYALDILEETSMLDCKPVDTPMDPNIKLIPGQEEPLRDPGRYRRLVGKLNYLTITRPDISFPISVVSQFLQSPCDSHWDAVIRILRYIKSTPGQGVLYENRGHTQVVGYTDANWAGSPTDRRSTSGYCVFIGGNLISWKSKKQDVVVRYSAEAEYRAMTLATCELIWLKHLLRELRFGKDEQMKLICDNQAALHIASNPVFHERIKHIEVDCHFIREKIASRCVATSFVNSNDQLADIFTKSLRGPRIKYICNKLGAYNIYAPA